MSKSSSSPGNFFLALVFMLAQVALAGAQTSTFTYQGRFTDGGTAANGTYDMQFKLFDGGGNQIGSTTTNSAVSVANGVFTVQLDYGAAAFPGADRFLEISVRPAGSADPYTVLAPRQQLTSTPYAIRSATADTAANATQLNGTAADQYVLTNDSRLTDSRTPAAGSGNYIQNTNAPQAAANFNISGNGTAAGALSASVVSAATQYDLGGERFLSRKGLNNTFAGQGAGVSLTFGQNNAFFGRFAGGATTFGSNNTYMGSFAGNESTGEANAFFGAFAGENNETGGDNSFFGSGAGGSNKVGSENAFFGKDAGRANLANNNAFFGSGAGMHTTTGGGNSFFGHDAGLQNTNGFLNAFFGTSAGEANTSATRNAFFGAQSGQNNNTGEFNSFFGYSSGYSNTTGSNNSMFGEFAGSLNTTASDNSYFGYQAGSVSTGAANAYFGSNAGRNTQTGFANSFVGNEAGRLTSSGFNNTFFGRSAGISNTVGSSNTVMGALADVDAANLTFATAIGAGAHVNASNTIVLGRSDASDTVRVPGILTLGTIGAAGITSLCRNAVNQISSCSSSLRYKKELQPFTRGLALLNTLKPISFKWKDDNSPDLGFGAEDVAAVEPLLVTRNAAGQVEGVKYDRITAVLVNAVKELQQQVDQQRALLQQQQTEFQSFKNIVCKRDHSSVCSRRAKL